MRALEITSEPRVPRKAIPRTPLITVHIIQTDISISKNKKQKSLTNRQCQGCLIHYIFFSISYLSFFYHGIFDQLLSVLSHHCLCKMSKLNVGIKTLLSLFKSDRVLCFVISIVCFVISILYSILSMSVMYICLNVKDAMKSEYL